MAKIKECMSRIDEIEKLRHDSMEMNLKLLDSALEKAFPNWKELKLRWKRCVYAG